MRAREEILRLLDPDALFENDLFKRTDLMFSTIEDPIRDEPSLRRWMRDLEEDEGLRIVGKVRGFAGGGFLFVGFHQGMFRVNICDRILDRKKRTYTAGRGGEWHEFDSFEKAWDFVRPVIRRPVQAWVY